MTLFTLGVGPLYDMLHVLLKQKCNYANQDQVLTVKLPLKTKQYNNKYETCQFCVQKTSKEGFFVQNQSSTDKKLTSFQTLAITHRFRKFLHF